MVYVISLNGRLVKLKRVYGKINYRQNEKKKEKMSKQIIMDKDFR